jgi:hypothetical protein
MQDESRIVPAHFVLRLGQEERGLGRVFGGCSWSFTLVVFAVQTFLVP